MSFTTNTNNKYTVSIITDPTGGDGMSTPSGYESVYVMEIIPNSGEVIIAGDLTIDSNSFQPGIPPQPSLHSITPVSGLFQLQEYFMQSPAGHPEIDVIGLYEVYRDDNGGDWDLIQGPQPLITINTNPIKLRLYISLDTSFTNATPFADTDIFLDIDLVSLVPVYGCTDPTAFNHNALANTDDGSCIPIVIGCMDATSDSYNANANTNDATLCEYWGCIDSGATNYGVNYTHDCGGNLTSIDTTCCQYAGACNTPINLTSGAVSLNYDSPNNVDCSGMPGSADDSCCHYAVPDCLDVTASNYNYNVASNTVNGTVFNVDCSGVVNPTSGSEDYNCCNYITNSCTDSTADNYDSAGTHDCNGDDITDSAYVQASGWDSCCTYTIDGCMDDTNSWRDTWSFPGFAGFGIWSTSVNWINTNTYNFCVGFTAPTTSFSPTYYGGVGPACFNSNGYEYENYNPDATVTNLNPCVKGGCMDSGSLIGPSGGGTDPYTSPYPGVAPHNYDSRATYDNGTCVYMGCMDSSSNNYDPIANVDSVLTTPTQLRQFLLRPNVVPPVPTYDPVNGVVGDCAGGYNFGCTDATSSNYDATATIDDGSCCVDGCMDDGTLVIGVNGASYTSPYPGDAADNYDASYTCDDGTYCTYVNVTAGCMDSTAQNYDSTALTDDGSCIYGVCYNSALTFGGGTAATNYSYDCYGVQQSSVWLNQLSPFYPSAECNVQTSWPGIRNNACEYQCATYTATVDSSTGGVVVDIDATNMPNTQVPVIQLRLRYGEVGTPVSTWQGYVLRILINAAIAQLTYDRASGWTAVSGVSNLSSQYPTSNTTIWKAYNTPMQPITFANTPNEVAYMINASCAVMKQSNTNQPAPDFGWYWNSTGGMQTCRQTLFAAGFAYRFGCTDSTADNYDPGATIDDGSCTYPCDCASNYTISQQDVSSNCGTRLLVTVDNLESDPACIPCPFPDSIYLEVDENGTNPLWGGVQTYMQSGNFYNNFGNLSFQSGVNYANTPLRVWNANAPYLGGSGTNGGAITNYPIVLEFFLAGYANSINTDATSPEYDYDIMNKSYTTTLTFVGGGSITSSTTTITSTPSSGCGNSDAINYDSSATCPTSSDCYFCPDSTNSAAIAGVNMVNDFTVDIQAVSSLTSGPTYTASHDPFSPTGGSPVPPDNFTWSFTNVNHSAQGDTTGVFTGNPITATPTYPTSLASFDDPSVSAYPPGSTITENGVTYDCSIVPSTSHLITLTLEWLDPNTGNSACTVSSPYGNLTPEPFYFAFGCTDPQAFNYGGPCVTIDDGSCTPAVYGCLCSSAINYFPGANTDDGSCLYAGCTSTDPGPNPDINGFCSDAVFDSSIYTCGNSLAAYTDYGTYYEYDSNGNYVGVTNTPATGIPSVSLNTGHACGNITAGLPNIGYNAINHDPLPIIDDGSCII